MSSRLLPAIALLGLAAAAAFSSAAQANPTVAVQLGNQTGTSNTSDWAAGFAFTVTTAVHVTHLGKFDQEADGIVGTDVALYDVYSGVKLATVSLVGAKPELSGSVNAYDAAPSKPVALVAGTTYAVYAVNDGPGMNETVLHTALCDASPPHVRLPSTSRVTVGDCSDGGATLNT